MSNERRLSYALIDGVEVSELELLRYEVKCAQTAAFLLLRKNGCAGGRFATEGRYRDNGESSAQRPLGPLGGVVCSSEGVSNG